jgi:hypothetical protein
MNKHELAEELRRKQLSKAEEAVREFNKNSRRQMTIPQFRNAVTSCSDEEIILSYITCSSCGALILSYDVDVDALARSSNSADEWLDKTYKAALKHRGTHVKL